MTKEKLKRAKEIEEEVKTLEAECSILDQGKRWEISNLLKKPNKKTYKNLYCIRRIDSIDSAIFITPDETELLWNFKLNKIVKLKKELEEI